MKEIRKETARRKKIWTKMEAAARDAVSAVRAHARSRKVEGMEWFTRLSSYQSGACDISFVRPDGPRKGRLDSFTLQVNGVLERNCDGEDAYEGYPNLTDQDPIAFKKAAVKILTGYLNEYIEEQQ